MQQPLGFTTKNISYSFKGSIHTYISGIDLSCNNLIGNIPPKIGSHSKIQVLNLSHNNLTGTILPTLSNPVEIESLNLSYDILNGNIPPQLTQLYSLAFFSVAHINLSGKTPERVAQFATFDMSSYDDNPFLCGLPLPKSCIATSPSMSGFIDMGVLYMTFLVSYFMVLLGIAAILHVNLYWQQT